MLIDDEVDLDEVWPEYGDEDEEEGSVTKSESLEYPVHYSEGIFYDYLGDEDPVPRPGSTANCTSPFTKVTRNEEYASDILSELVEKLEEESTMCFRYLVPEVLGAAPWKSGKTHTDREPYLKHEGLGAPSQSSLPSDVSSIAPLNRETSRDIPSASQLEQEFYDAIRQVGINLTGAMLDIVNISIHTQMQWPILESIELPSHHDSPENSSSKNEQVEDLLTGSASSPPRAAVPDLPQLSKKQEKHRRRKAKSKAKKRQMRVSGCFPSE